MEILGFILFVGIIVVCCIIGHKWGRKFGAEAEVRRRQRYIESGYYNAQLNQEAMRRACERNGW